MDNINFYNKVYKENLYSNITDMEQHRFYPVINKYIRKYHINENKLKVIEIGSGRGALQDITDNYTGVDLSNVVAKFYHKPFVCSSADNLPFDDNCFDVLWSYNVLEHIENLEDTLNEMIRVTKSNGHIILFPAWHCHKWLANGYQVRSYSDFDIVGKTYKLIIPLLNSKLVKAFTYVFRRCFSLLRAALYPDLTSIRYGKLDPNYDVFWQPDSDACNYLDAYDFILWFEARGHHCVSHPTKVKQFFHKGGEIDILVYKR